MAHAMEGGLRNFLLFLETRSSVALMQDLTGLCTLPTTMELVTARSVVL
jgi:hypothetical protein